MLLDQKLILLETDLAAQASGNSDVIDISNLGMESSDLMAFVLFKTEANAGATLTIDLVVSAVEAMTSTSNIGTLTRAPATTAVPAGTLIRFPIPVTIVVDGSVVSPLVEKPFMAFDFTQSGSPAADELILGWVGRMTDIPVALGGIS